MTIQEKQNILEEIKDKFRKLGINHVNNTLKLESLKDFKYNPFLIGYLTYFHSGDCKPENIAKSLLYPRVLGTSITTSFGTIMQELTHTIFKGEASGISGMDFEFTDQRDGVYKYAQLKSGPETLNGKDVDPLIKEFDSFLYLARTNKKNVTNQQLLVCIIYGERWQLNPHYVKFEKRYEILIGAEFWTALTGDSDFYFDLIDACAEIAFETNGKEALEIAINNLATSPEIIELSQKLMARK